MIKKSNTDTKVSFQDEKASVVVNQMPNDLARYSLEQKLAMFDLKTHQGEVFVNIPVGLEIFKG